MRIKIRGKSWKLVRRHTGPEADGYCNQSEGEIIVGSGLKDKRELEVLVHEMLHAAFWDLDEGPIDATAEDIATVLWKLGYRKEKRV